MGFLTKVSDIKHIRIEGSNTIIDVNTDVMYFDEKNNRIILHPEKYIIQPDWKPFKYIKTSNYS